jgi:hypothetical protein
MELRLIQTYPASIAAAVGQHSRLHAERIAPSGYTFRTRPLSQRDSHITAVRTSYSATGKLTVWSGEIARRSERNWLSHHFEEPESSDIRRDFLKWKPDSSFTVGYFERAR